MAQGHPWKSRVLGLGLVAGLALTGAGCFDKDETAATATPGATVAATATVDAQGEADLAVATPTLQIPALNLEGTVVEVADGAVLVDLDGHRLLLPDTLTFEVDGEQVQFADLDVGTDFTVSVPATSGTVVALLPDALVVDADTYGTFMVPSSMIPNNVLAQTKVPVRLRNGNEVTVPLTAAMNMVRSQGAQLVVDGSTLQTLTSGTDGYALYLGKLEDGNLLVLSSVGGELQLAQFDGDFEGDLEVGAPIAFTWNGEDLNLVGWGGDMDGQEIELSVKRGDSDETSHLDGDKPGKVDDDESADLDEGQGQDSAPGQEIAPANPSTPPGLQEDPGRGRDDAPGQSIAPGQQGEDESSELDEGSDETSGVGGGNGNGKGQGGGKD